MKVAQKNKREEKLFSDILWLNAKILGLVLGIILGLVIFVATNWLVIKGGNRVGPHLSLLSFIGLAYGFALGTLSGTLLGWIYNKITTLRNGKNHRGQ